MILKQNNTGFGSVRTSVLLNNQAEIMNEDSVQFPQILLKTVMVFPYM